KLRLALRKKEKENVRGSSGVIVPAEPVKQRTGMRGPRGDSLTRADLEYVTTLIEECKREPGFFTAQELAVMVGAKDDLAIQIEVKQHAKLWHERGKLEMHSAITETTRTPANKKKPETYTLKQPTYDGKRFVNLWNDTYSPEV